MKSCPKTYKSPNLVTLSVIYSGLSKRGKIDWRDYQISFYVSSVEASADIAPFAFLSNWKTIIWK